MKKQPLYKSFGHAFQGIFATVKKERNIKIHLTAMSLVIIVGALLGLSVTEWCICILLFGLVISLELVNTAVEAVVDLATDKLAKDAAAGAVLVSAMAAAVIGLIIFIPKLVALF